MTALESALAKLERRKSQPPLEREEYTRAEALALMAFASSMIGSRRKDGMPDREQRRAVNKAAWRDGDRTRWGGEDRSGRR